MLFLTPHFKENGLKKIKHHGHFVVKSAIINWYTTVLKTTKNQHHPSPLTLPPPPPPNLDKK